MNEEVADVFGMHVIAGSDTPKSNLEPSEKMAIDFHDER
jgi:hypothetical protein